MSRSAVRVRSSAHFFVAFCSINTKAAEELGDCVEPFYCNCTDHEHAATTARELDGFAVQTDVTDSGSVNELAEAVIDRFGRVDILVNNAGIHIQKLAIDLTDEEWDRVQHVNARGCFYTCRAFAPHMMRRESGRIINIITRLGGNVLNVDGGVKDSYPDEGSASNNAAVLRPAFWLEWL